MKNYGVVWLKAGLRELNWFGVNFEKRMVAFVVDEIKLAKVELLVDNYLSYCTLLQSQPTLGSGTELYASVILNPRIVSWIKSGTSP